MMTAIIGGLAAIIVLLTIIQAALFWSVYREQTDD